MPAGYKPHLSDRQFLRGHQAALAATLGPSPYPKTGGCGNADSGIAGVIAFSGAYDLNRITWGNRWTCLAGAANTGFTTVAGATAEEARRIASPLVHFSEKSKPILFLHSDDDRIVPVKQAIELHKALTAAHVFHRFVHYSDKGHMGFTDDKIKAALSFIAELEARK